MEFPDRLIFCYRETQKCIKKIKNWFVRPLYLRFSCVKPIYFYLKHLHFASSPVILFQDGVFDITEGFLCSVEAQLNIIILQNIDSNNWWQYKSQGCLAVPSSISLSVCGWGVINKLIIIFLLRFLPLTLCAGKVNKSHLYIKRVSQLQTYH